MKNLESVIKVANVLKQIERAILEHGETYLGEINIETFGNTLYVTVKECAVADFECIFSNQDYIVTEAGNGNMKFMITIVRG